MLNLLKRPEVLIAAGYLLFCFWYTNTKGPLTAVEIDGYLDQITARETATRQLTVLTDFMQNDTGNQFVMVNLIDLNPTPPNLPATGPDADPMTLIDHYMEIITDPRFSERHEYKLGGLLKTIAVPTEPILNPGDPRLLLGLIALILALINRRRA